MIEEYKNYCVIKAFYLNKNQINECKKLSNDKGLIVDVIEENYDFSIIIKNKNNSEIDFNEIVNKIKDIVKDKFYCDDNISLEKNIVDIASKYNFKLAIAESITGGMVCAKIVNVPGSSNVLQEGFVTYASAAKVRRLHVKTSTLDQYGAVSKQTCEEMLQGLLQNKDIQYVIATTGCAGPGSDEFNTPIGRVYVGVGSCKELMVKELNLEGSREEIRKSTTNIALYMLLKYIEKNIER